MTNVEKVNQSEEIIKVNRNDNAVKVDACILTFSHVILKYVLENFECKKIGDLFSSNGVNPVYGFEYKNRYFAVYILCRLLTQINMLFLVVRDV